MSRLVGERENGMVLRFIYPLSMELIGSDVEFLNNIHYSDTPFDEKLAYPNLRLPTIITLYSSVESLISMSLIPDCATDAAFDFKIADNGEEPC